MKKIFLSFATGLIMNALLLNIEHPWDMGIKLFLYQVPGVTLYTCME